MNCADPPIKICVASNFVWPKVMMIIDNFHYLICAPSGESWKSTRAEFIISIYLFKVIVHQFTNSGL